MSRARVLGVLCRDENITLDTKDVHVGKRQLMMPPGELAKRLFLLNEEEMELYSK